MQWKIPHLLSLTLFPFHCCWPNVRGTLTNSCATMAWFRTYFQCLKKIRKQMFSTVQNNLLHVLNISSRIWSLARVTASISVGYLQQWDDDRDHDNDNSDHDNDECKHLCEVEKAQHWIVRSHILAVEVPGQNRANVEKLFCFIFQYEIVKDAKLHICKLIASIHYAPPRGWSIYNANVWWRLIVTKIPQFAKNDPFGSHLRGNLLEQCSLSQCPDDKESIWYRFLFAIIEGAKNGTC